MVSSNEGNSRKKRPGRKRQPPVAKGPPLQFVNATHPDDFKADSTMRNIRSHVMYKHRSFEKKEKSPAMESNPSGIKQQASQYGQSASPSPSPGVHFEDITPAMQINNLALADDVTDLFFEFDYSSPGPPGQMPGNIPLGDLPPKPASPPGPMPENIPLADLSLKPGHETLEMFAYEWKRNELKLLKVYSEPERPSLDELQRKLMNIIHGYCKGFITRSAWMNAICNSQLSCHHHASVISVYQDITNGFLDDSALTVYAKSQVIRMINDRLQDPATQTDDYTILAILHLLVSELGAGSDEVFNVHQSGLVRIVTQRGGLGKLGLDGLTAIVLSVVILNLSIFRGTVPHQIFTKFTSSQNDSPKANRQMPESPIYCCHSHLFSSPRSRSCSNLTYEVLSDMLDLTNLTILRGNDNNTPFSATEIASYEADMQQIYTRLLLRPSASESSMEISEDWIYETCRLAALIYCRSIIHRVPLSASGSVLYAPIPNPMYETSRHSNRNCPPSTLLEGLHEALDKTDLSDCWGAMIGVFLWVCLVGGAAAWEPLIVDRKERDRSLHHVHRAWMRKCFALYATKSSIIIGFEYPNAVLEAQRTMLKVQNLIR
ncbi:hypothetical protein K432DRAFT_403328 [Lepidopterella palustris CBS 459.81]|uniref:Tachykinin family protein n=1 Tax=Lepidopterella palustris CBS 459.81 TaxID=1314670 RepID=A0A8E2EDF9_9PEZI|nr:hypothetical protein K432DRAFT_403328 [Lepidopterella palustris CBS 459.81]